MSNNDLADLLPLRNKSTKNKSQHNVLDAQESAIQQQIPSDEHNSNQIDSEEVGTQMMISKANLAVMGSQPANLNSPASTRLKRFDAAQDKEQSSN